MKKTLRFLPLALVAGACIAPAWAQTTERITNGGFENSTTGWAGTTGVIGAWASQGQPAYEGTRAAYLGGNGKTTTETLYQTVTIPSTDTSATLSFYLHIDTKESGSTPYDKLDVQVRNASGTVLATLASYSNANAASGYQLRTFNLSAYKGQTIRIHFNMTEDYSLATNFMVDKVSLVTSGGTPTVPAVPTGLAAAGNGSNAITVTWNTVTGATGYDLQVDGVVKSSVTSPYSHTGLTAGSTHTYLVRAKNAVGTSAWSSQVSATTTSGGSKTLYTTCVQDDLDPADRTIFIDAMKANGYSTVGENTNVSSTALKTLMERSDITLLYHTGHGLEGAIATSNGTLNVTSLTSINNTHFIAATCLTLVPTTWKSKMSAGCQSVLGYTNYSWDITDNEVATKFGQAIGQGQSYGKAWYTCNLPYSNLADRWCAYIRETSGVVEYSARTGSIPSRAGGAMISLGSTKHSSLSMAETLTTAPVPTETFDVVHHHSFNRTRMETSEHFADFLSEGRASASTEEDARLVAEGWVKARNLAQDGRVDKVITVQSNRDTLPQTVGHVVRFTKTVGDLAVRGNGAEDHVLVFVKHGQVTGYAVSWSASQPTAEGAEPSQNLLTPAAALSKAAPSILRRLKGRVSLVDVQPCLGRVEGRTVPAYAFQAAEGGSLIVDARNGQLM